MSIDPRIVVTGPAVDSRRHVIILFGGWGSQKAGQPLAGDVTTGVSLLRDQVSRLATEVRGKLCITAIEGSLSDTYGLLTATQFIEKNFDPAGSLIVYGYSAGGLEAMRLTHHLWATMGCYDVRTNKFFSSFEHRPSAVDVRVDLLVTVDAASGPTSGWVSRRVFPIVRHNLNIYQLHSPGLVGSHGGRNTAIDDAATLIINEDWSSRYQANPKRAHGAIDNDCLGEVNAAIRAELRYFPVGDFPLPPSGQRPA